MTLTEKILALKAGKTSVKPGEIVTIEPILSLIQYGLRYYLKNKGFREI